MFADARTRFPHLYDYSHCKDELRSLPIKMLMAKAGRGPSRPWSSFLEERSASGKRPESDAGRTMAAPDEPRRAAESLQRAEGRHPSRRTTARHRGNIRFYEPHELRKLDVKPGVTGLAQVEGRGLLSFEETNRLDLEYLEARSFWVGRSNSGSNFRRAHQGSRSLLT